MRVIIHDDFQFVQLLRIVVPFDRHAPQRLQLEILLFLMLQKLLVIHQGMIEKPFIICLGFDHAGQVIDFLVNGLAIHHVVELGEMEGEHLFLHLVNLVLQIDLPLQW